MLVIILYHSIMYCRGNTSTLSRKSLSILAQWLAGFHNYTFFLVSGYIFYALKIEKGKYTKYLPFVCNKIKRLAIPAFFVGIFWAGPINTRLYQLSAKQFFVNFILASSPSHLWFLWTLFFTFLIFMPISEFLVHNSVAGITISAALFAFGQLGARFLNINPFCLLYACQFFWFFYLGFKLRQIQWDYQEKQQL